MSDVLERATYVVQRWVSLSMIGGEPNEVTFARSVIMVTKTAAAQAARIATLEAELVEERAAKQEAFDSLAELRDAHDKLEAELAALRKVAEIAEAYVNGETRDYGREFRKALAALSGPGVEGGT